MATGRRAFAAESHASLIAAVMDHEPQPILELQPLTPPALEHAVHACLAKDPAERWQSAHDVGRELEWIRSTGSQPGTLAPVVSRRRRRERIAWSVAFAALLAVVGLGRFALESSTREQQPIQAIVDTAGETHLSSLGSYRANLTISPDGQNLAFSAADTAGWSSLWIRPLGTDAAHEIPDTRNAWCPFWSPDGRYVAFFDMQAMKLKKVPIAGGSTATICDAGNGRGGSWSRDGVILFAPSSEGPLLRVPAGGGEPAAATALDSSRHERAHRFPCFLPDGIHFLFAALPGSPNGWEICGGSLRSREVKRILTAGSAAVYAEPGYLLYERDGRVMAQRFDPGRLEIEGDPVAIADAPQRSGMEAEPAVSVSRNGHLALIRSAPSNARLAMLDRTGLTRTAYNLPLGPWQVLAAAPDAGRTAVVNGTDIWIVDLERAVPTRFVSTSAPCAIWSPDGRRIAYVSMDEGREEIHIATLDGRAETVPTTRDAYKLAYDWTDDGRYIVFGSFNPAGSMDLWLLPLEGARKPVPYVQDPWWEMNARVSPDGRWLAYSSIETGQPEVYVQSFPQPGRKVRVSLHGGDYPMWSKAGRELLYSEGNLMIAVPVGGGAEFRPGPPHRLFSLSGHTTGLDVIADGDRFLVSTTTESRPRDIRIILNWRALLKR
jgi:dipeptidyl aminopeptidase/acylaminoacyl peptidase